MSQHQQPDDDIRDAVAASGKRPWYADPKWFVPYPAPMTRNRILLIVWIVKCMIWGLRTASVKLWRAIRKHPWITALGIGAGVAMCPVCMYSTGCIIGGMAIWGLKSESGVQEETPMPDTSHDNPAGEFLQ